MNGLGEDKQKFKKYIFSSLKKIIGGMWKHEKS